MPHASSYQASAREEILLSHTLDITPVDKPLFSWPNKSFTTPTDYLRPASLPFGRDVAEWQQEVFGGTSEEFRYRDVPLIQPIRPDAPTLVAIFYPDELDEQSRRRSNSIYLERLSRLAAQNEQTIVYAPPSISEKIRTMRSDVHWLVIDDYATVWDIPNNKHQRHNFTNVQPKLFDAFEKNAGKVGFEPEPAYNNPHRSAVYNAKAFVSYDAVMRNPFGSDRWMYLDAGIFDESGPLGQKDGRIWGDILGHQMSTEKFDRSIAISQNSGVVVAEYRRSLAFGGDKDINHPCWVEPSKSWMCEHFMAQGYVGNSLGMLNYSIRFMQTIDDMDANGFYTGREEFVMPHVALRYPNTIFTIPWMVVVDWGCWDHPIKGCYTTFGGEDSVPSIGDPLETLCTGYKGRQAGLDGSGVYKWPWWKRMTVYGRRY